MVPLPRPAPAECVQVGKRYVLYGVYTQVHTHYSKLASDREITIHTCSLPVVVVRSKADVRLGPLWGSLGIDDPLTLTIALQNLRFGILCRLQEVTAISWLHTLLPSARGAPGRFDDANRTSTTTTLAT